MENTLWELLGTAGLEPNVNNAYACYMFSGDCGTAYSTCRTMLNIINAKHDDTHGVLRNNGMRNNGDPAIDDLTAHSSLQSSVP